MFLLLFALFMAVFLKMWAASRSTIDYDAERSMEVIAGGVLESLALQESPAGFEHAEGISAVGLYDSSGAAKKDKLFVGRPPERIDISRVVAPYHISFMPATRTLVLIRPRRSFPLVPVSDVRAFTMAELRLFSSRRHSIVSASDFIYIEADGRNYARAQELASAEAVLGTVVCAALCVAISFLLIRNQGYREKISREQSLIRLGEAARTLAHEMRNPLASIRVQAELLRATFPRAGSRELRIVEQEVQRLDYLAERTGDLVRDPLGTPSRIDLDEFLRAIAARFGDGARYRRIGAEGPVFTMFDPHRLRSVMENVVRNGLQWSVQGEKRPVEVRLLRRQRELVIEVHDNGPGIPRKDRRRVFEPLFTTQRGGWGLGLSIARQFVEAAKGRIEISSPVGGGTTVSITIAEAPP
jgi:signal transduction histidine kinase